MGTARELQGFFTGLLAHKHAAKVVHVGMYAG
jgi:hypothetical protein